ncbi:ZAR1-like protein, partial [Lamprotornis superbus]
FLEQKYGYFHCKDCKTRWESAYVWCISGSNKVYFKQLCRKCQKGFNPYRVEAIQCQICSQTRCSCPQRKRHIDLKRPHRQELCGRCRGKRLSCDSTYSFKYVGLYGGKWEKEDSAKPAGISLAGFVLLKARQTGLLTPLHHHSSRAQQCQFAWSELCAILDLIFIKATINLQTTVAEIYQARSVTPVPFHVFKEDNQGQGREHMKCINCTGTIRVTHELVDMTTPGFFCIITCCWLKCSKDGGKKCSVIIMQVQLQPRGVNDDVLENSKLQFELKLTGTRTLELDPDEVEEVLLVTAIALGLPSRPEELCSSSYRLPIIGVLNRELILEEVELELKPESGTGDDWYSRRKSKPPASQKGGDNHGMHCWASFADERWREEIIEHPWIQITKHQATDFLFKNEGKVQPTKLLSEAICCKEPSTSDTFLQLLTSALLSNATKAEHVSDACQLSHGKQNCSDAYKIRGLYCPGGGQDCESQGFEAKKEYEERSALGGGGGGKAAQSCGMATVMEKKDDESFGLASVWMGDKQQYHNFTAKLVNLSKQQDTNDVSYVCWYERFRENSRTKCKIPKGKDCSLSLSPLDEYDLKYYQYLKDAVVIVQHMASVTPASLPEALLHSLWEDRLFCSSLLKLAHPFESISLSYSSTETNVAQYNMLTDFKNNYADPLVMPAGKEANCGKTCVTTEKLLKVCFNKKGFSMQKLCVSMANTAVLGFQKVELQAEMSYVTWLSKAQGEGAGLWEQETSPVVAGTNGTKTWEWVLASGQDYICQMCGFDRLTSTHETISISKCKVRKIFL